MTFSCSVAFTSNPLLLRSRGVDEEGIQSLTRVILCPISQIFVNVTLKLIDACVHNSTSRKSIPIVYYPLSERVLSYIKPRVQFVYFVRVPSCFAMLIFHNKESELSNYDSCQSVHFCVLIQLSFCLVM